MRFIIVIGLLLLSACGAPSSKKSNNITTLTPAAMVAQIRSAGLQGKDLTVTPLRDPQVEDLRNAAAQAEARNDIVSAQLDIKKALAVSEMDPDLLQWQAELFLLQKNWLQAEASVHMSYNFGPKLGALCRRNWKTLSFTRQELKDPAGAQLAEQKIVQCTVSPPPRY